MIKMLITGVRTFFAVAAASCVFALASQGEASSSAATITVMSYNIHYGVGTDGVTDLERIAKVISSQDPDIVGLQEIGSRGMAMELGRLTGMRFVFGPSKERQDEYGDAILSKHPFEWVANYSIPSASSSRYQAMAIDVDLSKVFGDGATVRFINTHFDWLRTLGSQEARLAAVEVIERGFFADSTLPSILTGDLNATPDSPPLEKLIDKGWRYENLGKPLFTIGSGERRRQIDYVLVRSSTAWQVLETVVLDEPIASDHLPIVMKLRLVQK